MRQRSASLDLTTSLPDAEGLSAKMMDTISLVELKRESRASSIASRKSFELASAGIKRFWHKALGK